MLMLSQKMYGLARRFVNERARPLDRALADCYFGTGSTAALATALAACQNPDGGFGNAIEPDFRLKDSSPLGTTVGLQYALEVGLPADHPVVVGAMGYLVETFDAQEQRWHAVPVTVNDAPHAPWWSVDPATGRCSVETTWANPNAEIVGYLLRYRAHVPKSVLVSLTELAIAELARIPPKLELHDFLCYQRLSDCLPEPERRLVLDRLMASAKLTADLAPERWDAYGAKPALIAPSPRSPFAPLLEDILPANLDYEIERVRDDGSWRPNWSWAEHDAAAWQRAEGEWAGYITVKTLKCLSDFGRIA